MASSPRTLPNPVFRSPHACLTGPIALPHRSATYSVASHPAGAMRWEGVDENLARTVTEANLDHAPERRRIRSAFRDVQLGIDHCLFKAQYTGVVTKEWYVVNSRGLEIFSKSWIAENSPLKALVCFCHGYGDTCTFFFEGIAKKLASSGYGVFALDYPGFGLSDGLHGYIPSFDSLANDVAEHFAKIKENLEYKGLPSFLFGQSMGGAVALKVHFKQPNAWDGAVLVAPMCKMADNVVPPWPIQQILIGVAKILPKGKLVPQKDLAEMAFKDARKRELCSYNIIAYKDKPRLRTALEMLRTTQEIERRLEERIKNWRVCGWGDHVPVCWWRWMVVAWRLERPLEIKPMERGMFHGEAAGGHGVPAGILVTKSEVENNLVSLPLLILHGEADIVTDPSVSKALYEKASSSDKKLCLYKDAYHSLLEGESDESIFKVLDDIISWLDKHSVKRDL